MIQTYIHDSDYGRTVSVSIVRHDDDGSEYVLRLDDSGNTWCKLTHEATGIGPTLTIDQAFARPLLDALTRHYNGAEDTRALRKDYDAERARVDKLTDHLIRTTT